MATSFRYEFKWKNFGFSDCKPIRFYRSQWGWNRPAFIAYRLFMCAYALVWYIVQVSTTELPFYIYLTNWTEAAGCMYFTSSAIIAIYGLVDKDPEKRLRWFHKLAWMLFSVTFGAALITDLAFWIILSKPLSDRGFDLGNPLVVHSHAVNFLMILVDLFVTSHPVRLLHFVYPMTYGLIYVLYSLLLHWTGVNSAVYIVLDWAGQPGQAAGYSLVISGIFLPLAHAVGFGLYHFRSWVARLHKFEPFAAKERRHNDTAVVSENTTFTNFSIAPK